MTKKLKDVATEIQNRSTEVEVRRSIAGKTAPEIFKMVAEAQEKGEKLVLTNTAISIPPKREVILEGDPEAQLAYAQKAAKALFSVMSQKKNKVMINGKQYLEFGDWQTVARFYGATVGIEWTKPMGRKDDPEWGFEARAIVYRGPDIISSAEAMCTADEARWGSRWDYKEKKNVPVPAFQRRSMAQTRASAKALRNALGWVAELAGYASTPLEEMDGVPRDQEESPGVVIRMDEPKTPQPSPRNVIAGLLLKLGKDLRKMGVDEADKLVKTLTGLEMEVPNYEEICLRLGELVSEKKV